MKSHKFPKQGIFLKKQHKCHLYVHSSLQSVAMLFFPNFLILRSLYTNYVFYGRKHEFILRVCSSGRWASIWLFFVNIEIFISQYLFYEITENSYLLKLNLFSFGYVNQDRKGAAMLFSFSFSCLSVLWMEFQKIFLVFYPFPKLLSNKMPRMTKLCYLN